MKIWYQFGSEHSANLVMIGHFKNETDATKAKGIIDAITQQVREDESSGNLVIGSPPERFGKNMLDLLVRLNFVTIGPSELEQFAYDVAVNVRGNDIVVTTEEVDVSAFLKVMFNAGARIEVYSAHDYKGTGYGRGE